MMKNAGHGYGYVAALAVLLQSAPAFCQAKDTIQNEAKATAAKLRSLGEPKDRCTIGAIVVDGGIVTRRIATTPLAPGDEILAINQTDVAGKANGDIIALLRTIPAAATIPVTVRRDGKSLDLQVTCTNARPGYEAMLAGLDQASTGKFDDCASTFADRQDLGAAGAVLRFQCASVSKNAKNYNLGQLAYDVMRLMIEDATWARGPRASVVERLHQTEGLITQSLGAAKFAELVDLTRKWPGGEDAFAAAAPDWALFRRNAERALIAKLIDPDSARIEWPYGFIYGSWKPLLDKRIEGYWTCGSINARNRMGGYTGSTSFVVVLDHNGSVLYSDMGSGRDYDFLSMQCAKSVKLLPPPPAALAGRTDGAQPAPSGSIADELKKLVDLKNSGAITEAEFEAAKRKLLGTP